MPPHIRDPPSPTMVPTNGAIKCGGVIHRTSDRNKLQSASTHDATMIGSASPFNHDIDVTPREQRMGKSVSFNPILRFKAVKHINDYCERERHSIFLTEDDLDDIFDHCVETVRMMVRGEMLAEEDGYSTRGLEFKTPRGAQARKDSKAHAMKLVLDEQERQVRSGYFDCDMIATIYRDAATGTRRVARIMAMKDEEAARPMIQSKSSILLLRQKKVRGDLETDSPPKNDLLVQDFDASATSVTEEFNLSWENCLRPQHTPTKGAISRVRFGEIIHIS